LGINSDVYGQGNGVTLYKNQYFKHAISVHGDSNWQMPIPQGAQGLSFGIGMGARAKCSDGITFKILLDDKMVFSSKVNPDDFSFNNINISKQQRLTLITEAGSNNACDHGIWIQPTFEMCPNGSK
jgi:hypothetical protein